MDTTILIVTHDPGYRLQGRTRSDDTRRQDGDRSARQVLSKGFPAPPRLTATEEFILVDGSGRVQIPRDIIDRLKIGERARIDTMDGMVTLTPDDVQ